MVAADNLLVGTGHTADTVRNSVGSSVAEVAGIPGNQLRTADCNGRMVRNLPAWREEYM